MSKLKAQIVQSRRDIARFLKRIREGGPNRGISLAEGLTWHITPERRSHGSMRVLAVLVGYDGDRTTRCIEALRAASEGWTSVDTELIVVANSQDAMAAGEAAKVLRLIAGSNEESEFSGYREGVQAAEPLDAFDCILLANDRMLSYKHNAVQLVDAAVLSLVSQNQLAVGKVEHLPRKYDVLGHPVHRYIRSNFILMPASQADVLESPIDEGAWDRVLPRIWAGPHWREFSALDPDYLDFLINWLATTTDSANVWYRARPLSPEYWPTFRRKSQSIIYEAMLSAKLQGRGAALVESSHATALSRARIGSQCRHLAAARTISDRAVPGIGGRVRLLVSLLADAASLFRQMASAGRRANVGAAEIADLERSP